MGYRKYIWKCLETLIIISSWKERLKGHSMVFCIKILNKIYILVSMFTQHICLYENQGCSYVIFKNKYKYNIFRSILSNFLTTLWKLLGSVNDKDFSKFYQFIRHSVTYLLHPNNNKRNQNCRIFYCFMFCIQIYAMYYNIAYILET